jgi:hypothetical protein
MLARDYVNPLSVSVWSTLPSELVMEIMQMTYLTRFAAIGKTKTQIQQLNQFIFENIFTFNERLKAKQRVVIMETKLSWEKSKFQFKQ